MTFETFRCIIVKTVITTSSTRNLLISIIFYLGCRVGELTLAWSIVKVKKWYNAGCASFHKAVARNATRSCAGLACSIHNTVAIGAFNTALFNAFHTVLRARPAFISWIQVEEFVALRTVGRVGGSAIVALGSTDHALAVAFGSLPIKNKGTGSADCGWFSNTVNTASLALLAFASNQTITLNTRKALSLVTSLAIGPGTDLAGTIAAHVSFRLAIHTHSRVIGAILTVWRAFGASTDIIFNNKTIHIAAALARCDWSDSFTSL